LRGKLRQWRSAGAVVCECDVGGRDASHGRSPQTGSACTPTRREASRVHHMSTSCGAGRAKARARAKCLISAGAGAGTWPCGSSADNRFEPGQGGRRWSNPEGGTTRTGATATAICVADRSRRRYVARISTQPKPCWCHRLEF
jgi:hypothetical protein